MRHPYRCVPEAKPSDGRTAISEEETWEVPKYDTRYRCDDGIVRTWEELTKGLEPDVYPSCREDFDTLMFCYGAEEVPA